MVMRIGGLASGMDIDALVEKLMKAERMPLDRTFQKKQTFEWQRDAYRSVNSKLKTFDTFLFDKMILSGKMNQKSATSSNEQLVSVKGTPGASGNISIGGVSQLASAAQSVGRQTEFTGNSKLSELQVGSSSISIRAIGPDGRLAENPTEISFSGDMTVNDLVKEINNSGAGVTAIFEGGKLSVSAKNTGSEKSGQGEILVTGGMDVFGKLGFDDPKYASGKLASDGKNAMFEVNGIQTERSSNTFTISGYELTLKETFNAGNIAIKQLEAAKKELTNAEAAQVGLQAAYDAAKNHYFAGGTESPFKTAYDTAYQTRFKKPDLTDFQQGIYNDFGAKDELAKLTNDDITTIKTKTLEELKADTRFKNFKEADLARLKDNPNDIEKLRDRAVVDADERLYKTLDKELLANDDAVVFLKGMEGKSEAEITKAVNDMPDTSPLKKTLQSVDAKQLKLMADNGAKLESFRDVANAQVTYVTEKAAYEATENAFKAGEIRVSDAKQAVKNAEEVANSNPSTGTVAPVTMKASSDTKAAMEQIKEFVAKYNEMIEDFNKQLKETKYRDYAPLTKEQREDMSEYEQKIWDEKAKSGLLRSDSQIREGMANMRLSFMGSVGGLGDKLMDSLAEIGITTTNDMTKSGQLVIDDTKLEAALAKDPDQVHQLFAQSGEVKKTTDGNGNVVTEDTRGIAWRLRDAMKDLTKNIEKKAGKDGAVNNTFGLGLKINETDDRITKLQAKLKNIEARYWKQFTAMEQAINKANSQSSMFMQQ
ncbi:flagellar filament capping protein FliD [Lysinibacillus sp. NPDC096418]|uniref:flagellar filament capping protein FliD n=1 Tax=Lysinibacillus sp. NPDC096418 TaxID=3364138 RepID=UPI003817F120